MITNHDPLLSVRCLEAAINGRTELQPTEKRKHLCDSLIQVVSTNSAGTQCYYGQPGYYTGSGLLLTTDGFLLTPYHLISPYVEDWKSLADHLEKDFQGALSEIQSKYFVIDQASQKYPIDVTCWLARPEFDLALIKAITPHAPRPISLNARKEAIEVGEYLEIYGFVEQRLMGQIGRVTRSSTNIDLHTREQTMTIPDSFTSDAYVRLGYSGSAIVDRHADFIGMTIAGIADDHEYGYCGGIKSGVITEFLSDQVVHLMRLFYPYMLSI